MVQRTTEATRTLVQRHAIGVTCLSIDLSGGAEV